MMSCTPTSITQIKSHSETTQGNALFLRYYPLSQSQSIFFHGDRHKDLLAKVSQEIILIKKE